MYRAVAYADSQSNFMITPAAALAEY